MLPRLLFSSLACVLLLTSYAPADVFTYRVNPEVGPTLSFSRGGPFVFESIEGFPVGRPDETLTLFARGEVRGEIDFTVDGDTATISRFDLTVHNFIDFRDLGLRPDNNGPPRLPPIADGTPLSDLLADDPIGLSGTISTEQDNSAFVNPSLGLFGPAADRFSPSNIGGAELFTSFVFAGADFLDGNFSIKPVVLSTTELEIEIQTVGGEQLTLFQAIPAFAPSFVAVPEPSAASICCLGLLVFSRRARRHIDWRGYQPIAAVELGLCLERQSPITRRDDK